MPQKLTARIALTKGDAFAVITVTPVGRSRYSVVTASNEAGHGIVLTGRTLAIASAEHRAQDLEDRGWIRED